MQLKMRHLPSLTNSRAEILSHVQHCGTTSSPFIYAEGEDAEANLDDGCVSRGALWWLNDIAAILRNNFSTHPLGPGNPFLINIVILPSVKVSENGDNSKSINIQVHIEFVRGEPNDAATEKKSWISACCRCLAG
jgi:hypothetical protein